MESKRIAQDDKNKEQQTPNKHREKWENPWANLRLLSADTKYTCTFYVQRMDVGRDGGDGDDDKSLKI